MHTYVVHGLNIQSDINLKKVQNEFFEIADLTVQNLSEKLNFTELNNSHELKSASGEPIAKISSHPCGYLKIDYFQCAEFYFFKNSLFYYRTHSDWDFFTAVLTTQIIPLVSSLFRVTLHGCVVVKNNSAFLFLGPEGAGKSTLTTFFKNKGYEIFSDDVCAVEIQKGPIVLRGMPEIRLNPDSCQKLLSATELKNLTKKLAKQSVAIPEDQFLSAPIKKIFSLAPNLTSDTFACQTLSAQESLLELVKNQFRFNLWKRELIENEFSVLTYLIKNRPIQQLSYPFYYESLPWIESQALQNYKHEDKNDRFF